MEKRFAKVGKKERGRGAEDESRKHVLFETNSTRAKGCGGYGARLPLVSCCRWFHYDIVDVYF